MTLKVGVLRFGDINLVSVNGEIYSQIGMRVKAEAPASKTIVVTLANGSAGSGYIYSDEAYSHLTFQVIGSRLTQKRNGQPQDGGWPSGSGSVLPIL